MGTSTSSKGGKAGSPFDPEWLTPARSGSPETTDSQALLQGEFAPSRRFAEARTRLSEYISGGGRESLRAATRSMVSRGMGGSARAASTMRGTARGAGALGQFLSDVRDKSDARVVDWINRTKAANLSAQDLILEIVNHVIPQTGSVDEESTRNASTEALGQLYELHPEIDIFSPTNEQIRDVMAITIANDVCNRLDLQLGQMYERLKYDPSTIQVLRTDVKEYVQSEVRLVMESVGSQMVDLGQLASDVLSLSLKVFES